MSSSKKSSKKSHSNVQSKKVAPASNPITKLTDKKQVLKQPMRSSSSRSHNSRMDSFQRFPDTPSTYTEFSNRSTKYGSATVLKSGAWWLDLRVTTGATAGVDALIFFNASTAAAFPVAPDTGAAYLRFISSAFLRFRVVRLRVSYVPSSVSTTASNSFAFGFVDDPRHPVVVTWTRNAGIVNLVEGLERTRFFPSWSNWTEVYQPREVEPLYMFAQSSSPTWADLRQAVAGAMFCFAADTSSATGIVYGRFFIESEIELYDLMPPVTTVSLMYPGPDALSKINSMAPYSINKTEYRPESEDEKKNVVLSTSRFVSPPSNTTQDVNVIQLAGQSLPSNSYGDKCLNMNLVGVGPMLGGTNVPNVPYIAATSAGEVAYQYVLPTAMVGNSSIDLDVTGPYDGDVRCQYIYPNSRRDCRGVKATNTTWFTEGLDVNINAVGRQTLAGSHTLPVHMRPPTSAGVTYNAEVGGYPSTLPAPIDIEAPGNTSSSLTAVSCSSSSSSSSSSLPFTPLSGLGGHDDDGDSTDGVVVSMVPLSVFSDDVLLDEITRRKSLRSSSSSNSAS